MRILLVEADLSNVTRTKAWMAAERISLEVADTAAEALDLLRHYPFDLVLANALLPDADAAQLTARLRAAGNDTPLIAVTARVTAQLRLKIFAAGADDVVEQGIATDELLARIRAVLRRVRGYSKSALEIGPVTLDLDTHRVEVAGRPVDLTGKEFELLRLLILRRNVVLSKETILSNLYGGLEEPSAKIVDVFVCKLRRKLTTAGAPDLVKTIWGRGYTVDTTPTPTPTHPTNQLQLA